METDLIDKKTKMIIHDMTCIKQQWQILFQQINTFKRRYSTHEITDLTGIHSCENFDKSNENFNNSITNCLILIEKLIEQHKQIHVNTSSDNNDFLSQFQKCQDEINDLNLLIDTKITSEMDHLSTDDIFKIKSTMSTICNQLKIQIEKYKIGIDLDTFIEEIGDIFHLSDQEKIRLALMERQKIFVDLIQLNQENNDYTKERVQTLIRMWSHLSSMIIDSPSVVTKQLPSTVPLSSSLSCVAEFPNNILEQAQNLLKTVVQLGNRQEIEQLKKKITLFLLHKNDSQVSNLKLILSDKVYNDLANRQLILQQMLIDTLHIDRLRVNFVAHFNTENNILRATNEITTLINNYPKEMTTQVRQWLNDQQRTLTIDDMIKYMDEFEACLKEIEENLIQYQKNDTNRTKLKNLIQQLENRVTLFDNAKIGDRERIDTLKQHFSIVKQQFQDVQNKYLALKTHIDGVNKNMDELIIHIRDIESEIQNNIKQPITEYEKLIPDCQRIISKLDQEFRPQIEQAINNGERLYTPDITASTHDETSGDNSLLSSSPTIPLKKHSDLTLRKVRRHVLQLNQHWKNANNSIQYRLRILQRIQTAVEGLRRKCDQLHAHLLEIELAHAHKSQIKALSTEQVPIEIEQAKQLMTTLMSCKPSIDDIRQTAQNIENEYNIQTVNRADELEQRWEHSTKSIMERIKSLQDSIKHLDNDIYSSSVEYPWQRAIALHKIPYYINHSDQTTSWDHPKLMELMRSLAIYNDIKFSAYRTAMKLRKLQKHFCLDFTSLDDIISVVEEHQTNDILNQTLDVQEILDYLQKIFNKTSNTYPQLINVILTVDLILNWLLNIYDLTRTGSIKFLSMKMALALLCRGNIEEKYRYIFSLVSYEYDGQNVVDHQRLAILFQQAIVIPKQLGEIAAFGGSNVEPSVQSCFEHVNINDGNLITEDDFLDWIKLEPQSLVWLPVMHRLAASEAAKHEARCNICKVYPILGFRYRSLKHFNCDICQNCFFSGKRTKYFRMDHPLQEYYTETTPTEDIRDFFRTFKNKLCKKHRKSPKLGYLPLPHVFDNTITTNEQQNRSSPIPLSPIATPFHLESDIIHGISSSIESDDEHGIIAQHCKSLNSATSKSARVAARELLISTTSLDNDQRNELEAIIRDLEDENRLLQNEYQRLCQENMEQSVIVNDLQEFENENQLNDVKYDIYNNKEMKREAKQLRQYKMKLEQRMKVLEEHNKQLEKQLKNSKQLLHRESPSHSLRRSVDRNLERQSHLITIDNLFHMADDINRAVGDLVSVITEPQQSSTSSTYYQPVAT